MQPRVVDPVRVGDQRVGQRAQIEQPVPIGVAPRQPRDLDPDHDPDPAQTDLSDQPLEAVAAVNALARPALILGHDHLRCRPAERDRPLDQLVLALPALAVALDLRHRRLARIHVRPAREMLTLDPAHPCSHWVRTRAIARASRRRIRSCAAGENDSHIRSIRPGPSTGRASWRGVDSSPRTGLTSSSCWRFSSRRAYVPLPSRPHRRGASNRRSRRTPSADSSAPAPRLASRRRCVRRLHLDRPRRPIRQRTIRHGTPRTRRRPSTTSRTPHNGWCTAATVTSPGSDERNSCSL